VQAGNPEGAADEAPVDPASWVKLELTLSNPDDTVDVVLLRPRVWADTIGARVGSTVALDLPELGASGPALVTAVGPCPPLKPGTGRVVTGTFRHRSARVLDLAVEGSIEPIGVTANHPFWSEDRQRFVPAGALRSDERLRTPDGEPKVVSLTPRAGEQAVYNIEVHAEHVYRVSASGILVHNSYAEDLSGLRITNKVGAGAARSPQHHIFPQEYRNWFTARGVPIDKMTVALDQGTHSAIHTMGWNSKIMDALFKAEAAAGRNLTAKEIFQIGYRTMRQFNLRDLPFLPF
jgi:hypothetical protein